ncbi:hypothetical protein D918_07513 [Trichuris suis]|nr:hypothetical protein D918_07513 [Trichuris suis]
MYDLRILESYQYMDERDRDQGQKIRHRVKEVIELLQDDERLQRERKIARFNKSQYICGRNGPRSVMQMKKNLGHICTFARTRPLELSSDSARQDLITFINKKIETWRTPYKNSNSECCDRKKQQEFTFPCSDSDTVGQFDPRSSEHDFPDSSNHHVLTKNASAFGSAAQIPRLPSPPTIGTNVKPSAFQETTSVPGTKLLVEVFDAPTAKIDTSDWPGEKDGKITGIDEFSNFVSSSKAPEPDEKKFDIGAGCVDFTSFASYNTSLQEMKQHNLPLDPMMPTCLQSSNAFESNTGVLSDPFEFGSICGLPSQVPCIPIAAETTATSKPAGRKLPDTWSDIHKIGLDLDCLSLENKPRKQNALSMNELQEQNRRKMQLDNPSSPLPSSKQRISTVNHGTLDTGLDLLS